MFVAADVKRLLSLHEKSYGLLKWSQSMLPSGRLSFAAAHARMQFADAALDWLQRHQANIPPQIRVSDDQLPQAANLFTSFLTTSFRLNPRSAMLASGCACDFCRLIRVGPNLELRSPSKRDAAVAQELKVIYLRELAAMHSVPNTTVAVESVLNDRELAEDISAASWLHELQRRSEFSSQGTAALALWRQFAWKDNRPRERFSLKPELFIAAESRIAAGMTSKPASEP